MSIIDLPLELLHQIGNNLSPKNTRNLISTSRRMHSVFQRKLYTDVVLGDTSGNDNYTFLYAVVRNPELAGYVQTLALSCWETSFDSESSALRNDTDKVEFDGDLIRTLVDEATDYPEKEKSKWFRDLENFDSDAWLALIVPRLTNLRKLGFEWPYGSTHVSKMLKKVAMNEGACLPHLEEVNMCWYDTENAVGSCQMHPFFKFPSVRKIGGWKMVERDNEGEEDDDDDDDDEGEPDPYEILQGFSLPPRCSNVTDIDLSQCNSFRGMRQWIQACKALKTFRIIHGGVLISYDDSQPQKLYSSLSLHKSTLEAIWVEHDEQRGDGNNDNDWMGSFVDFSALKFLRIFFPNLVGLNDQCLPERNISDVIPSSLETLYLDIDRDSFLGVLDDLAEMATSKKFSKLTTLHVDTFDVFKTPEGITKIEWLQEKCQEVGVALHVHDPKEMRKTFEEQIRFQNSLWPKCAAEELNYCN